VTTVVIRSRLMPSADTVLRSFAATVDWRNLGSLMD